MDYNHTREYLLAPGPTPVPTRIIKKMARPIIHHRTKEYTQIYSHIRELTKYVFQTKSKVVVAPGSGTAGLESAIINAISPGDKVLTLEAGGFGERWSRMAKIFGAEVSTVKAEWGKMIEPEKVKKALEENRDIKVVFSTLNETSTGVTHDIKAIAEAVRSVNEDILIVVDGISGIGCIECPMDEWGLDVVITASQKGLMCPPGIYMVGLSEKALEFSKRSKTPKFFFDYLAEIERNEKDNQSRFTPPVSLMMGLEEALIMFKEEGIENIFKRHASLATATRGAFKSMGLELFAKEGWSNTLTAAVLPKEIGENGTKVTEIMREKYGVTIAGGQKHLKGKIIRFGHMGYVDRSDVSIGIMALATTLKQLGFDAKIEAALEAFVNL